MPTTINATCPTLITRGTPSPSRLSATAALRAAKLPYAQNLAKDLENLSAQVNSLHGVLANNPPSINQILLRNAQGQIVAAFGDVVFEGVRYTNYLSEIHVGNPLNTRDPSKALLNANVDGSVTIGQNGWLEVLDPFNADAAWIGTRNDTRDVTGAADNGNGLIRLEVIGHTLETGNLARVELVGGVPNATGKFTVTNIDTSHVDLQDSVFSGVYTSGGVIDRVLQIADVVDNGAGLIRIVTATEHLYESGTKVDIPALPGVPNGVGQWIISLPSTLDVTGAVDNGAGLIRLTVVGHNFTTGDVARIEDVGYYFGTIVHGVPNANGYFPVTVVDVDHIDLQGPQFEGTYTGGGTISFLHSNFFDLVGSTFSGTYSTGGTCLQYFAGMLAQTVAIGESFINYRLRMFPDGSLRIRNALIELTSATGHIVIDPNTTSISVQSLLNMSSITLDATVPSLTLRDQTGTPTVTMEILQETPLAITSTTHASPDVITVPGHTYVNGDTVLIQGATGDTAINGYRIVENLSVPGGTFDLTDLAGNAINGNGTYAGGGTAMRYYAGLLAQVLALGSTFDGYRMRFFADGRLVINRGHIEDSWVETSSIGTANTFAGGTGILKSTAGTGIIAVAARGDLPSAMLGTRAARIALDPVDYPDVEYYETDTTLVYLSDGTHWLWESGTHSLAFAQAGPFTATLGTYDAGLLLNVSDYAHILRWGGATWGVAPGERMGCFLADYYKPPTDIGWVLADGSVTTYLDILLNKTVTPASSTVLNLANATQPGYAVTITGATGAWSGLNDTFVISARSATTITIPFNSAALTSPITGSPLLEIEILLPDLS